MFFIFIFLYKFRYDFVGAIYNGHIARLRLRSEVTQFKWHMFNILLGYASGGLCIFVLDAIERLELC